MPEAPPVSCSLPRLISAQNAGTDCNLKAINPNQTKFWGNSYSYDAWGNLLSKTPTKCNAENLALIPNPRNRADNGLPALQNYGYDAAGNMTFDVTDGVTSTYDAENRISTASNNGVTTTYVYDADGNRVKKTNASSGTLYWYMTPGIVAESDLGGRAQVGNVFFGGERVARRDLAAPTGIFYYFSDHLKTASVITDSAGVIKAESDYYPWGGELQFVNADSNHYKFTGKERYSETGLDYFGARYYSNGLGRFVTPDWSAAPVPVPYADLSDSQSLNQYTYVRNLPTTRIDADGHCGWDLCIGEAILVGEVVTLTFGEGFAATSFGALIGGGAAAAHQGVSPVSCYGPCSGNGPLPGTPSWNQMMADIQKQRQASNQNDNAKQAPPGQQSPDKTSASEQQSNSASPGGGRNERKQNQDKSSSAQNKYNQAKADYEKANKMPPGQGRKEAMDKAKKDMKHWQKKAAEKSETHSRKEKGQQQ